MVGIIQEARVECRDEGQCLKLCDDLMRSAGVQPLKLLFLPHNEVWSEERQFALMVAIQDAPCLGSIGFGQNHLIATLLSITRLGISALDPRAATRCYQAFHHT